MKKIGLVRVLGIAILTISMSAQAGFWDWSRPYRGPTRDIITLVITSNYKNSRLMADLIQNENKQPYILLPAVGQTKIFFCPAREKALEIQESELPRFIKYLNPRQILVIGDKRYVSDKYLKLIDQNQTVITVKNTNWNQAAQRIETLMDLSNLSYDFKHLSDKLESGQLYRPTTYENEQEFFVPESSKAGAPEPAAMGDEESKRNPADNAATIDVK
ncbi:MAG: hypothetical protein A2020_03645 [Lentisphaerae bacterium GWF2_45_14]|nr:MAG: hypothetical protein A2020_03645 [Lentisphaerae bacterium GWF2_45_14]